MSCPVRTWETILPFRQAILFIPPHGSCISLSPEAVTGSSVSSRNQTSAQTTTPGTTSHTSSSSPASTVCAYEICTWSDWYDEVSPSIGPGDIETFQTLRSKGIDICDTPKDIQCRAEKFPNKTIQELGQKVKCTKEIGLICYNKDQKDFTPCLNYQIKILCCIYIPCTTTTAPTTSITTKSTETTTSTSTIISTGTHVSTGTSTSSSYPTTSSAFTSTRITSTPFVQCLNETHYRNGTVIEECQPINVITCYNDVTPDKVYKDNVCCFQYKCPTCIGPDGLPRELGESWIIGCEICVCDSPTSFHCTPVLCHDSTTPEKCQIGFEAVEATSPSDTCCKQIHCVPMNVCVYNGQVYQIGSQIPTAPGSCLTCECTCEIDVETGLKRTVCISKLCQLNCLPGFEYQERPGECCGDCVQVACVIPLPNGSIIAIQPGETWYPPGVKCYYYKCDKVNEYFPLTVVNITCPSPGPLNCMFGILEETADGCCQICKAPGECGVQTKQIDLNLDECNGTVDLQYCNGLCASYEIFSAATQKMDRACMCCQAIKTSKRKVDLMCPDGKSKTYLFTHAESCGCAVAHCVHESPEG